MSEFQVALREFTRRYHECWRRNYGCDPGSRALYGITSPCVTGKRGDEVVWQPQPFLGAPRLDAVERALDIVVRSEGHEFFTTQFAADMDACYAGIDMTLLQTWSDEDFLSVQENLIGHLVAQRRMKLSPTLFLATVKEADLQVVSLCNMSGAVVLETLGSRQREVLCTCGTRFLQVLEPMV